MYSLAALKGEKGAAAVARKQEPAVTLKSCLHDPGAMQVLQLWLCFIQGES